MKYLLLFILLVLIACEHTGPIGYCNPIGVSKDTLSFSAQGGVDSVSVSESFWRFANYDFAENNCEEYRGTISEYCAEESCYGEIIKAKCSWFELQKTDAYTITVFVNPNGSNQERLFRVYMPARNCATGFTITQSAE
ncbi:MAG: hypothetical protein LBR60_00095 [Fibrobacter sp.]|jgi:hypothetical protein|nr:hypothetical protein [Fibrobacter sp.]